MSSSFRDLRVWQNAMKLATKTYKITANFPQHEVYGLSQQMRRAAVSVPSNIAEGKGHRTDKGFANFLFHGDLYSNAKPKLTLRETSSICPKIRPSNC